MSAAIEASALAANPSLVAALGDSAAVAMPIPRKFKASDLPLPSATRTAIEGLAHSFKKKGGYDAIRKQVWEEFEAGVRILSLRSRRLIGAKQLTCHPRTMKPRSPKPSSN